MKAVSSAKVNSVLLTFAFPALTCRAFLCRRFTAEMPFIPPLGFGYEFHNSLVKLGFSCLKLFDVSAGRTQVFGYHVEVHVHGLAFAGSDDHTHRALDVVGAEGNELESSIRAGIFF